MENNYYIHDTAFVEDGVSIGNNTKIWHFSHVMKGAKVGENCILGQNVFIGKNVRIGNGVKIQNNVSVYTGVEVEDDVFLGPLMVFTNVINPRSFVERKDEFKKTIVRKGATIGANATIICGNEIGAYAMIGAGTVITKNVLEFGLVVGNPGKRIGWVSKYGHRLEFIDNRAKCIETGDIYILEESKVRVK